MVEADRLIEDLGDHVQWRAQNRIALTDGRANELLWAALAALDGDPKLRCARFRCATPTTERRGRPPLPIRRSAHDIFAGSYALLVVTPVSAPRDRRSN